MKGGETIAHTGLKQLALEWARSNGYTACAAEVALPRSGYRADAVAYRREKFGELGFTAAFECKQSRSDFLRDSHAEEETLSRLKSLQARREKLEELLRVHCPTLRTGETLFPEFDRFDFTGLEHENHRTVMNEISRLQNRLLGKTKLDKLTRYACVNLLYLVVEPDVLEPFETPLQWGLLVRRSDHLELERKPAWLESTAACRLEVLHRIARAKPVRLLPG
jgi:hypothetical protein